MSVTIFTILQYAPSLALPPSRLFSQVLHFEMGTNMQFLRINTLFCIMHFLFFSCCTYIFCQKSHAVPWCYFSWSFFHNATYVSCSYVFHFIHIILTSHWFTPTLFPLALFPLTQFLLYVHVSGEFLCSH